MEKLENYLKELVDEGIINYEVKNTILFLVKNVVKE
jgi:hypothetical protein